MLQRIFPEKGDSKWFLLAVIAALITAAVVAGGTRLIIGAPTEGANGLMQAFLAGLLIFGSYWLVAATAGYFGLRAMPMIMSAGIILAVVVMLFLLTRPGDTGWSDIAAVAALVQLAGLAVITGVVTEVGLYVWNLVDSRKRA